MWQPLPTCGSATSTSTSVKGNPPFGCAATMDVYHNERIGPDLPFMAGTATERETRRFRLAEGEVLVVGSEEAPRRADLRPPLKRLVRFSRKPLSQRCLIGDSCGGADGGAGILVRRPHRVFARRSYPGCRPTMCILRVTWVVVRSCGASPRRSGTSGLIWTVGLEAFRSDYPVELVHGCAHEYLRSFPF